VHIIYEDDHIIVIDKPAWQLCVPGKDPLMISTLQHVNDYLGFTARVVHRLDCATSGVMIFAKSLQAQRHLHLSFRQRKVAKIYHALICGKLEQTKGHITLPLMTDWPQRPKQKIDFVHGKAAHTDWQQGSSILLQDKWFISVELRPKTGRTHQLRLHMASQGNPILGDRLYGAATYWSQPDKTGPFCRLYLHASKIYLQHPITGKSVCFQAQAHFMGD